MLTILGFGFQYHMLQLCLNVMYITPHLDVIKDSWYLGILKTYFEFENVPISQLSNCEHFLNVGNSLLSLISFYHQNCFTKKVLKS
jgi:hypothetical protein